VITAFALQRLEIARAAMVFTDLGEHQLETRP